MNRYLVFQQRSPKKTDRADWSIGFDSKTPFEVNLHKAGAIHANSGEEAIEKAKKWEVFRRAVNLGRFPIVQLVKEEA